MSNSDDKIKEESETLSLKRKTSSENVDSNVEKKAKYENDDESKKNKNNNVIADNFEENTKTVLEDSSGPKSNSLLDVSKLTNNAEPQPNFPLTPPREEKNDAESTIDLCEEKLEEKSIANQDECVIILSDDDNKETEDDKISKIKKMREAQREEIIKLRKELRKEEAKLVLLKKIRHSQVQKAVQATPVAPPPNVGTIHYTSSNQCNNAAQRQLAQKTPSSTHPAQIKGTTQQQHNASSSVSTQAQKPTMSAQKAPSSAQAQANHNAMTAMLQMPHLMAAAGGSQNAAALLRSHPALGNIPGAAQLLMAAGGQHSGDLSSKMQQMIQQQARQVPTLKQQQAAAKLALRKQLEKTLLEIPPPKPPPPEINFLPSAASNEFICLVGLEEVVNKIQCFQSKSAEESKDKAMPPFSCMQCEKDFSPLWKVNKDGDHVTCLQCVLSNQKKALKAEHTNRLKTAFVKALQQEQEIEQKIQKQQTSEKLSSSNETLEAAVQAAATQLQQQQQQLKKLQEDQIRQHQQLLQRAQHQLQQQHRNFANFRPTPQQIRQAMQGQPGMQFSGFNPGSSSKTPSADRQFLLDMMPPTNRGGKNQQIKGNWK